MAARKRVMSGRPSETVDDFFSSLSHPLKGALMALRKTILEASAEIREAVKWNAPSFFMGPDQFFATANIHARGKTNEHVLLVLHRGVRKKSGAVAIDDSTGLLEWLSPDRAAIRFESATDVKKKSVALQKVIRQWITHL